MKKIALIGSTGSIGKQVLNVVRRHSDKFSIVSLAGGENANLFSEQVKEFNPQIATLKKECDIHYNNGTEFFFGEDAFTNAIVSQADVVVIAIVGFKGIVAVLDAIKKGKNIALANKESLVVGGDLVTKLAKEKGVNIIPIDSEHSAIFQALNYDFNKPYKKLILTCSGGAFRDYTVEQLKNAKAEQALKHPTWQMGAKITIDCATLVNKGFEVIEAKWLYNADFKNIDVIIHRESIIHSMVEFDDNSVIASMSYPTMELPITLALTYPDKIEGPVKSLDFAEISKLTFESIDKKRFPCFDLAVKSGENGGIYPALFNGANETAVKLYLEDKISFYDIYEAIDKTLNAYKGSYKGDFYSLQQADEFSRSFVLKGFDK